MNEIFPHKFLINLDRRPDRFHECEREFQKYNINSVHRFSAVDGRNIQSTHLKSGEIAAIRSHRSIYEYCLRNDIQQALIFEDDVAFFRDVMSFSSHYKDIPSDWQIVYLGGNHLCGHLTPVVNNIYRTTHSLALHAYGLRQSAMKALLQRSQDEQWPIDVYVATTNPTMPCYAIVPVLAMQRHDFSDIQDCHCDYRFLHLGRQSFRRP